MEVPVKARKIWISSPNGPIDDTKAYGLLQCIYFIDHFDFALETQPSLLCRGLFVLQRGQGERKRKRTGVRTMGRGKRGERLPSFPSSRYPWLTFYLSIIAILLGYPAGAFSQERGLGWYWCCTEQSNMDSFVRRI